MPATRFAQLQPLQAVVFVAVCTGFVQHVITTRQVQPARSLTDLTHLNTQMYNGMVVYHAAVCCYLPVVVFLLHAQGLCNMSIQPGRYSLSLLTDFTSLNSTDVTGMPCISCRSCRSYAAVCCYLPVVVFLLHRVCATCQYSQVKDATGCSSCRHNQHIRICLLANALLMCSKLFSCSSCCCLLAVVLLLQAQGLCNT
jgi:hypothetical protein